MNTPSTDRAPLAPTIRLGLALAVVGATPAIGAQEPPTVTRPDSVVDSTATASSTASRAAPAALDALLSPDGRTLAFRARVDGVARLFVRDALDTLAAARPSTPAGRPVGSYAWAPDSRHLVFTDPTRRRLAVVEAGTAAGGGGAVGARAEAAEPGGDAPPPTPSASELVGDTGGSLRVAGFASDPPAVLVEVPGRWPQAPDLVRVDLETGAQEVVMRNDGGVRRWMPDGAGAPRLGIREDEDGGTELVRHREGELVPVYRCEADQVCEPLGFHPDGRIWIRSDRGRDAVALLLLDPLTAEVEVVRTDLGLDTRAAFRDEATFADATTRVRDVVGEDPTLTFQRPDGDRGRWLVSARGPEVAELLLFDAWSGAVRALQPLAPSSSPSVVAPAPDPSALEPARLAYRITEDEGATAPVEMIRRLERASEDGSTVWRVVDEATVPTYGLPDADMGALADMDMDDLADDPDAVDELLGDDPSFDPFAQPSTPTGSTEATDVVVLHGASLAPIRRRSEGAVAIRLDFTDAGVRGGMESDGLETPVDVPARGPVWSDGAALETLVAALPLADGYRTRIPVLATETAALDTVTITVTGTDQVTTPAGSFDVWRLDLGSAGGADPESTAGAGLESTPEREETWLVRRSAPHHLVRAELRLGDLVRITELVEVGGPS